MEPLVTVKRKTTFKKAVDKPKIIRDSRFGIRVLPKSNEHPQTYSYMDPGKGPNGEHLS